MASPFQLGYVTSDLDAAIRRMVDEYGTGEFIPLPETPGGPRIALGYAGDMMVELIEVVPGSDDLYERWLDGEGFELKLHHLGMRVDDVDELASIRQRHVELGNAIASEGATPGFVDYLYADTSERLGHYLEYIVAGDGAIELFSSVPGSTFTR